MELTNPKNIHDLESSDLLTFDEVSAVYPNASPSQIEQIRISVAVMVDLIFEALKNKQTANKFRNTTGNNDKTDK